MEVVWTPDQREFRANIIAERLLGLPKDVDPQKGLPFDKRVRS